MESHSSIYILVIVILIVMSAYFSATETAFSSFNRIRLKNMADNGDRRARAVLRLSEDYDKLLSTILIGNNIVNIAMTSVATVMFIDLVGSYGPTVSTVVMTVLVLIFGEISPKSLAKETPEKFAMFSARFLPALMTVLSPLNFLFSQWKKLIAKIFKVSADGGITEEELITMVEVAETEGAIDEQQSELIQNAIEFDEVEVCDILKPRTDVVAIDADCPKEHLKEIFRDTGYSRVPVYGENIDQILGVINQKDFHNFVVNTDKTIRDYIQPVFFTVESAKISQLLKKMQSAKTHMAVVVDEYGGTVGIVTLEDIIEELVGEIWDEHDEVETPDFLWLADGKCRVRGNANLEKMFDLFGLSEERDATTVNGWAVEELDKLPEKGDRFVYRNLEAEVTDADGRKATELIITVHPVEDEDDEDSDRKADKRSDRKE
ncbi:HlyC/CorC family transporter [Bacilliculturomica massiliensis]|uniref:HlyC/CorC family transporter n=1 Tax=Bacilliculturomica massiliensis TaxID=1917867 RepID=UPI001030D905|nr:hemolysin family protein [Bacilliculturomica massiliensis]